MTNPQKPEKSETIKWCVLSPGMAPEPFSFVRAETILTVKLNARLFWTDLGIEGAEEDSGTA